MSKLHRGWSVMGTNSLQSKNAAIASATSWFVGVGHNRTTFRVNSVSSC